MKFQIFCWKILIRKTFEIEAWREKITTKAEGWKKSFLCVWCCAIFLFYPSKCKKIEIIDEERVAIVAITPHLHWSGQWAAPDHVVASICPYLDVRPFVILHSSLSPPPPLHTRVPSRTVENVHLFSFLSKQGGRFANSCFPRWGFLLFLSFPLFFFSPFIKLWFLFFCIFFSKFPSPFLIYLFSSFRVQSTSDIFII